eukprot:jgi/Bigna1/144421/aug1.87_g19129
MSTAEDITGNVFIVGKRKPTDRSKRDTRPVWKAGVIKLKSTGNFGDLVNSLKKECQLSVEEKFIITNHMFVKCNGVRKYQITWKKEQPLSEILYKDPFSIVLHIDHVDSSSSAMASWERIVWRPS